MTVYTTYSQVGKAEDVSNILSDITPTDTPMLTMTKTEKVSARTFSFLEDSLRAAASNAKVEGADAADITLIDIVERTNNTQILEETFRISGSADAVKTYGRAKETALQLGKTLKSIKRDLEFSLVGVDQAAVAGSSAVARKMASLINQISTGVDAGANATDALTEAKLLEAGQTAFNNGSDPSVFMIKPADAQIVAGFSASAGRNREVAQGKTLVNVIDLYVDVASVH